MKCIACFGYLYSKELDETAYQLEYRSMLFILFPFFVQIYELKYHAEILRVITPDPSLFFMFLKNVSAFHVLEF